MLQRLWPNVIPTRQVVRNPKLKVPDLDGGGCPFWIEVGYRTDVDAFNLLPTKFDQAVNDSISAGDKRPPLVIVRQARHEALVAFNPEKLHLVFGDSLVVRRDAMSFHEWRRWSASQGAWASVSGETAPSRCGPPPRCRGGTSACRTPAPPSW